jgi:hypothetical protein
MPPTFQPTPPLIELPLHPTCRATVIIPARNEEQSLPTTLEALFTQIDLRGHPLDPNLYEVIVLLNNCTDASAEAVHAVQHHHPNLHQAERTLPPEEAHVGTARRLLMDTAWHRLQSIPHAVILSTDADTLVAPDWIATNLHAIDTGAEAVGGAIHLKPEDLAHLDPGTLEAYKRDRRYQRKVARLESLLDPDPADPWPRHLQHFGASLACTPAVYARAGGLPPIKPLEDVAFVDALRRADARLRHAPEVRIFTSARLDGRAEVGLSGQLRHWQQDAAANRPHHVQSAAYLTHRFTALAHLRQIWANPTLPAELPPTWREPLQATHPRHLAQAAFLATIDCNRLIDETFHGEREHPILRVLADLTHAITLAESFAHSPSPPAVQPLEQPSAGEVHPSPLPSGPTARNIPA